LVLTVVLVFAGAIFDWPHLTVAMIALGGILASVLSIVKLICDRIKVNRRTGFLIGVLTFAGGNLPVLLLVPIVLFVR